MAVLYTQTKQSCKTDLRLNLSWKNRTDLEKAAMDALELHRLHNLFADRPTTRDAAYYHGVACKSLFQANCACRLGRNTLKEKRHKGR